MEALHTAVLIFHVLGATLIVGVAFITLVVEIKRYYSSETLNLVQLIWKITEIAMGIQLLTGLYLASSEWGVIGKIPYFWVKMFLFFIVGTIVGIINRRRFAQLQKGHGKNTRAINGALLAFLTLASIAALGVLIAESAA